MWNVEDIQKYKHLSAVLTRTEVLVLDTRNVNHRKQALAERRLRLTFKNI